jgi:hypothetical protein
MKGKGFLKVTGILMVIFAGMALLSEIISLIFGVRIMEYYTAQSGVSMAAANIAVYGMLGISIVLSALELFTGIIGIKNCDKPDKSTICIVFGSIVLGIDMIGYVMMLIIVRMPLALVVLTLIIALISLALPVLYLIGAILNKNSTVEL